MNLHELVDYSIHFSMLLIGAAWISSLWRLLRGPSLTDRILALDYISILLITELILLDLLLPWPIYFESALSIAMLGFFSTFVFCKFLLRRAILE